MERKIKWESDCYDEIELIYEKAGNDEKIADLLSKMEEKALQEAEEHCGLIRVSGQPLTRERFISMPEAQKEQVIYQLSQRGLEKFDISISNPAITVTLSQHIQMVLGCTMFSILNRLEKLDGSYNELLSSKAVLELQVPLGGKTGLFECECLIMFLYAWISVKETSRNVIATTEWNTEVGEVNEKLQNSAK